jgi:GTPase involved in cell partitioning and DNA repair
LKLGSAQSDGTRVGTDLIIRVPVGTDLIGTEGSRLLSFDVSRTRDKVGTDLIGKEGLRLGEERAGVAAHDGVVTDLSGTEGLRLLLLRFLQELDLTT